MADQLTADAVQYLKKNIPPSEKGLPDGFVVQMLELEKTQGKIAKYRFFANDGQSRIRGVLPSTMTSEVETSKTVQNFGLLRIKEAVCNVVHGEEVILCLKCEVAGPSLGQELRSGPQAAPAAVNPEEMTPTKDSQTPSFSFNTTPPPASPAFASPMFTPDAKPLAMSTPKPASKIMEAERNKAAASNRMASSGSRRVYPLVSLNPYQGNWTIQVRVTNKGPMRTFKTARGEGNVFSVELMDEEGTEIQATMWREAADKFWDAFQLHKVYYISGGQLKMANRKFSTVKNEYELNLGANARVEEVEDSSGSPSSIPTAKYNFVHFDALGPYVGGRVLIDVVGVLRSAAPTTSIRRKISGEELIKREITLADQSEKTVAVTLWGKQALEEGAQLEALQDSAPVIAVRSLRVGDYQGVSLSTTGRSLVLINPDLPETQAIRRWYDGEGKNAALTSAGSGLASASKGAGGSRSIYDDRAFLKDVTEPAVGDGKMEYFNVRCATTWLKPDQAMWYLACPSCTKKVSEVSGGNRWWCEGCSKDYDSFKRRYIMSVKVGDSSGEAWVSVFNEQAEALLGMPADQLAEIKDQDEKKYEETLKGTLWREHVARLSVTVQEYMDQKRQRITVRSLQPVSWAGESKYALEQIAKLQGHPVPT